MSEPNWLSKWRDTAKAATPERWQARLFFVETEREEIADCGNLHDAAHIAPASPDRVLALLALCEEMAAALSFIGADYYAKWGSGLKPWPREELEHCVQSDTAIAKDALAKFAKGPGSEGPL